MIHNLKCWLVGEVEDVVFDFFEPAQIIRVAGEFFCRIFHAKIDFVFLLMGVPLCLHFCNSDCGFYLMAGSYVSGRSGTTNVHAASNPVTRAMYPSGSIIAAAYP